MKTRGGRVPPLCRREAKLLAARHAMVVVAATHSRGIAAAGPGTPDEDGESKPEGDAHLALQHQEATRGNPPNCAEIRDAPTILRGFGRTNTHWFTVGHVTSSHRPF